MSYEEQHLDVNGIDTAVFTAGQGDPVVLFHGGGTATGFDCLLPVAANNRLIVAHHPGFGASGDPAYDDMFDLVRHKLDLLDQLGVDEFALVGHSMGGWMAVTLASFCGNRVTKLVLAAPYGLRVDRNPTVDLATIPPDELLSYLAADMSIFGPMDGPPPPEFLAEREREGISMATIAFDEPYVPGLQAWVHRVTMPTLLLWGDADRIVPLEQAAVWADLLPNVETTTLAGVGHLMFDESSEAVDAVADFVTGG